MATGTAALAGNAGNDRDKAEAELAPLSFVRGSRRRIESFHDETTSLGASSVPVGPEDVPPLGFLRHVVIEVIASGGAAGAATVAADEDAPFSVLQDLQLTDVNGNAIAGPLNGYHAFLAEKYGAYTWVSDARQRPSFSDVDSDGNFRFMIRVPVEVSARDAFGSLSNMNSSQTYKLRYTVAASSVVFDTAPDTLPSIQVKAWIEAWAQPRERHISGAPIRTKPPAHGATQYLTSTVYNISSGEQTIRLTRTGNLIRTLIAILRDSAGDRLDADWPDPVRLEYDGALIESVGLHLFRDRIAEQYGLNGTDDAAEGRDSGVFVWCFHDDLDGRAGHEVRNQLLETSQATRLDVRGDFGTNADELTIITNDIAVPAGSEAA